MDLGKLVEVDVRKVWKHEQYDFSSWLAEEENISELGKTIGLSLSDVETEKFVGNYRCDIICKDEITGKSVLIENQLEPTNHDHLGKIITYASGLDATVVVWIVQKVKDEHASAIEWLNKHTDEDLSFFLIEVHAYQIENSKPAPMFSIIEQPNDFSKMVKEYSKNTELNDSQTSRLEFWNALNETLDERGMPFNKHKASTDHWYTVAVGSSKCHISIDLVNKDGFIRVGLWIPREQELFEKLFSKKEEIEEKLGMKMYWDNPEATKASSISMHIEGLNFDDTSNYSELINAIIDQVVSQRAVFKDYI